MKTLPVKIEHADEEQASAATGQGGRSLCDA